MAQKPAAGAKSDFTAAQLIEQGKALYRAQRLKPALAKFEAALKLEPENDEALSLAAVTAFRLDLQPQSRDYFVRRGEELGFQLVEEAQTPPPAMSQASQAHSLAAALSRSGESSA